MASDKDVYVTFGAETGDLEAAIALANSNVKALSSELRSLANEMRTTGASADSDLGQKMRAVGAEISETKARIGEFKEELNHGEEGNVIERLVGNLHGILGPITEAKEAFGEMAELIAAAFAVEKVVEFIKGMGELGEQTERTSKILGLTSEEVGQLNFAAAMTGTNTENLTQTMSRFELSLAKAATGTGPAAAGLQALGVNAKELIGLPLTDQLSKMAEAVSRFADGTNKTAAVQAVNRGFIELLPLLDEGAHGFDELKEKLAATNSVLSDGLMTGLVEMQHGFVELGAALSGDAVQGFAPFINAVNGATRIMTDFMESVSRAEKGNTLLSQTLAAIAFQFQEFETAVSVVVGGLQQLAIIGNAAFLTLEESVKAFYRDTVSVFGSLMEAFPKFWSALVETGMTAFNLLGQEAQNFGTVMSKSMTFDFKGARDAYARMALDAEMAGQQIKGAFSGVFDSGALAASSNEAADRIKAIWADAGKAIGTNLDTIGGQIKSEWGLTADAVVEKEKQKTGALNLEADKQAKAAEKAARDVLGAAMEAAQGEIKAAEASTKSQISAIDSLARQHAITEQQKVAMTIAALQAELKAEEAVMQQEMALDGLTLTQKQKLADQLKEIETQNAAEIQKVQQEGLEKTLADWRSYADTVAGLINGQVNGVLKGTTSIAQAFKNMAASAIEDIIKFCIKWAAEHAATVLANMTGLTALTTANAAAAAAQTASVVAGSTTNIAAVQASKTAVVTADSGTAAAGVAAWLAPLIGPAAIPAGQAAGAQVAAIGSMDIGAYNVPEDQLALIHKNELVMPAPQAGAFRSMLDGGGQGGGNRGGSGSMTINVQAIDATGVQNFLQTWGQQITQAVTGQQMRNPSLQGKW